jgi:hypothetical protein
MLAYITGTVDQELLLRNEYLAAENRILVAQVKGRLLLSDAEKATLAEIAHRLGRKALKEVAAAAKPDTLLAWYRKLIANKFDGSKFRKSRGRPRVDEETERLVVQMARENPGWGLRPDGGRPGQPGSPAVGPDGGQYSPPARYSTGSQAEADNELEGLYPCSHGGTGSDRLLHGGSADAERVDDLLCAVFHSIGMSEICMAGMTPSRSGMDGTDGAQCNDGGERFSGWPQVFTA